MTKYKILLHNMTAILLQNVTEVCYKMRQVFITKYEFSHKMRQLIKVATILLQNATVITKCT